MTIMTTRVNETNNMEEPIFLLSLYTLSCFYIFSSGILGVYIFVIHRLSKICIYNLKIVINILNFFFSLLVGFLT